MSDPPLPPALPVPDQEVRALGHMGLSFFFHLGLLAVSAFAIPPLAEPDPSASGETARFLLEQALVNYAEREEDAAPADPAPSADADGRAPVPSRCGELRGGSMGQPAERDRPRRYGVKGPADNPDPHVARRAGFDDLWPQRPLAPPRDALWSGDRDAPTAPWARDDALGTDAWSARGHLWGEDYGEAHGSPGVGIGRYELCETCGDSGRGAATRPAAEAGEEDGAPVGCLGLLLLTD
jgi:hypothetical protein